MSHGLSSRSTGRVIEHLDKAKAADAAMFYVRESKNDVPWHDLGHPVDRCLTAAEAIEAAGLGYEVKTGDVFDADMKKIENFRRTFRSDNGNTLGIVGNRYTVIQNADAFAIMDGLIGNGDAKFDTAGALFSGEIVFINARLPESVMVAGEAIDPYFLLKNTHDGSGSLLLKQTPIRVVCQNTLNMAIGNAREKQSNRMQKIKHTVNYEDRVKIAQKIMGFTSDYYTAFKTQADKLVSVKITEKDFGDLMNQLYPMPEDKDAKRANSIAERERMKLLDAFNADDLNNIRFTAWGAYNAIADYSDHMRESRGDNKEANAFLRTFEATDLKDKALELLLAKV